MKLEKGSQNTCEGKAMNALYKTRENWIPARQDKRGAREHSRSFRSTHDLCNRGLAKSNSLKFRGLAKSNTKQNSSGLRRELNN